MLGISVWGLQEDSLGPLESHLGLREIYRSARRPLGLWILLQQV